MGITSLTPTGLPGRAYAFTAKSPLTPPPIIYASSLVENGSGNSGLTVGDAVSLPDAVPLCVPGTIVTLLDGTYLLTASLTMTMQGTPTDWIAFQAQTPGNVIIEWGAVTNDPMFYLRSATGQHCCYIEISGLIFDGADVATNGIFCQKPSGVTGFHPHNIRMINNEIRNCGSAGIATIQADYITCIGNKIHHIGMVRGWGSGIALNTNIWADESPTFHNYILNNIISGVYDCCGQNRIDDPGDDTDITDGNGIIYDRSLAGNISPPVLIANNVIYMNGGRGILPFMAGNAWIVNNTCYKNGLDLLLGNDGSGIPDIGDIQIGGSSGNNYVFNNIVDAWTIRHPFALMPSSSALWRGNLYFSGDGLYGIDSGDASDPAQFQSGNPLFVSPPVVDPDDGGQYLLATDPDDITDDFELQEGSAAIDIGVDPRTVTGQKIILPNASEVTDMTDIFSAMTTYLLLDAKGDTRPFGGGDWDAGAYESPFEAAPPAIDLITGLESFWGIANTSDSHGTNTLTNNGVSFVPVGANTVGDFEASENDHMFCASNASLHTGDISFVFAAAVVPESLAGYRTILSKFNNTSNQREYILGINSVTSRFEFTVSANGTLFTTVSANSLGAPSLATLYYVIAWHDADANTINIQVNNGAVDSVAHSGGVFTGTANFYIGRAAATGGVPAYFDGIIGLIPYWKGRILSSDERAYLWNGGSPLNYAQIVS